jgi:hypothetical protein
MPCTRVYHFLFDSSSSICPARVAIPEAEASPGIRDPKGRDVGCVTFERRKKKRKGKKRRRRRRGRRKRGRRRRGGGRRREEVDDKNGGGKTTENRRKKMEYIKEGIMEMFYLLLRENDETVIKRLVLLLENPVELVGNPFMSTESDVITKPTQMLVR